MTGAYISKDGGNSWRMFNLGSPIRYFVFDPIAPQVIYAGAESLWRSADGGSTWNLVFPPPASVTRLMMPDDHASPVLATAEGPAPPVTALAVDPANSKILYATLAQGSRSALYTSQDWGATWLRSAELPARGRSMIYVDPHSPVTDRALYVIGTNSVSVRKAGHWKQYALPAGVTEFRDVAAGFFPRGNHLVIYALAAWLKSDAKVAGGIAVSPDGGDTWRDAGRSFLRLSDGTAPYAELTAVATSFGHPDVAYVSYEGLHTSPDQVGGSSKEKNLFHGIAKTTDAGRTWKLVWKEAQTPAPNLHEAWITERFGTGWGEPGISLGVAPTNPSICYETDDGRTMRTTDGGLNWEAVYSKRLADHTYTTTGLDVTTDYGIFFDPFNPRRMFIAYTDIGLFRSENGGQSWTSATVGVPDRWVNTTYWIVFDPEVKGRVWGAMSYTHDLPRPKMWRHESPSTYDGGVCISDDGGKTWRPSNQGMPPTAPTHIVLDPSSPVQARVLYATGFAKGVFKSVDGGETWALKNNGLPGPEPFAWRLAPTWSGLARDKAGALYLAVARRSEDGSFGNARDGALYRSRDGAEHWEKVTLPAGVNGPNGIAIDPDDPERLYLAAWGRATPEGAVQGGVFVSRDGGNSWRNTLSRDQHVYDITIDPRDPRTLYACGFESSAWRSNNRGETWQRIKGYNFKWGHRVIPDPENPGMIYVTTFGGSVWYGPASGDPHAIEDIVTPALAYGR
jgi:photosystem II stability/assembly factor-like uncharacterized protein